MGYSISISLSHTHRHTLTDDPLCCRDQGVNCLKVDHIDWWSKLYFTSIIISSTYYHYYYFFPSYLFNNIV